MASELWVDFKIGEEIVYLNSRVSIKVWFACYICVRVCNASGKKCKQLIKLVYSLDGGERMRVDFWFHLQADSETTFSKCQNDSQRTHTHAITHTHSV